LSSVGVLMAIFDGEEILLPYPPSINRYWRNIQVGSKGRTLISREGRDYREDVLLLLRGRDQPILNGRLSVTMGLHPPDKRRRDLDNTIKVPLDALTHAGVWLDDSQIDEIVIRRLSVVEGGLLKVTLVELHNY